MHHSFMEGDGKCLILFAGNMMLSVVQTVGVMTVLQALALAASIVASSYVALDHHKKLSWKKKQDKASKTHVKCDCEKSKNLHGEH